MLKLLEARRLVITLRMRSLGARWPSACQVASPLAVRIVAADDPDPPDGKGTAQLGLP
jgi:hypothetical protein